MPPSFVPVGAECCSRSSNVAVCKAIHLRSHLATSTARFLSCGSPFTLGRFWLPQAATPFKLEAAAFFKITLQSLRLKGSALLCRLPLQLNRYSCNPSGRRVTLSHKKYFSRQRSPVQRWGQALVFHPHRKLNATKSAPFFKLRSPTEFPKLPLCPRRSSSPTLSMYIR